MKKKNFITNFILGALERIFNAMLAAFIFVLRKCKQVIEYVF